MPKSRNDMIHWAVLLVAFLVALAVPFQFGTLWLLGSMTVFLLLLSWSISWRKGQRSGEGFVAADRSSWIFWVMVAVIAVMIPLVAGTPFFLSVMVAFMVYLTWNTMWGLVIGTAGLQSFATVAVAGLAAYVAAYLSTPSGNSALACTDFSGRILGLPVVHWYIALPIAIVAGVVVGFIISLPAIRLRGIYFALLTIGLVELCRAYVSQDKCNFGGAQGLYGADSFIPENLAGSLTGTTYAYIGAAVLALIALIVYWRVNYGRLGLLLRTARESEPVAEVLGVNVVRARLAVFLVSSAVLGAAGGFYTAYYHSISPNFFSFSTVLFLFAMVMIGGVNSPRGILIGTMLLQFIDQRFVDVDPPEARYIFIGLLLLVVTLVASDGLISIPDQILHRRRAGKRGSGPSSDLPEEVGAMEQEAHMPPGSRPETA